MLNFKVTFKATTANSAVSFETRKAAPSEIKQLRKAYDFRMNIDERIDRMIQGKNCNAYIMLNEDQAANVPALSEVQTGDLVVTVPAGFLNKFIVKECLDADKRYYINTTVNEVALYEAWVKAGCPTKWGFTAPVNPVTGIDFIK